MIIPRILALIAVAAACETTACGQQSVAFDNFGANDTFAAYGTWMGYGFGEVLHPATGFTPSVSGSITRIDAAMWVANFLEPSANQVTLYLLTGVGDVPPTRGALWSQTYSGMLAENGVVSFPVTNGPTITAGTPYWLYVETPAPHTPAPAYGWQDGLVGLNPVAHFRTPSGYWQTFGPVTAGRSLRVIVPEPSSIILLLVPLGFALGGRRRRR